MMDYNITEKYICNEYGIMEIALSDGNIYFVAGLE